MNAVNKALVSKFNINRLRTTPYHPQTDGMVERANSVILEMLHHIVAEHKEDWHEHLDAVAFSLRTSVDLDIGLTPFFMLYGREARLPNCFTEPVETLERNATSGVNSDLYIEGLLLKMLSVRAKVLAAQAKRGLAYAQHNSKLRRNEYMVGDFVMLYKAATGKLDSRYEGPYQITEHVNGGGVTFKLRRKEIRKMVTKTRHASLF